MNLTPAAPPVFLTPNFLQDSVGHITVTSMSSIVDRIVDMEPNSPWNSGGSTDSTNPQTIDIPFYVDGVAMVRTGIGMIALLNMNFKDFTVSLSSDGGVTFTDVYTVTGNTLSNYIIDASAATKEGDLIRIYVTTVFASTPNAEKYLGTVVVAGVIRQMLTSPLHPISREAIENARVVTLANGKKSVTYVKRSPASYEFYSATFKFAYMPDTELANLRALRRENLNFIFYPEPGDKPGEMFWSMFTPGSFKDQPSNKCKPLGNDVQFSVQEIG